MTVTQLSDSTRHRHSPTQRPSALHGEKFLNGENKKLSSLNEGGTRRVGVQTWWEKCDTKELRSGFQVYKGPALITWRGGYKMGRLRVRKYPPSSRQRCNPPFSMAKTSSSHVKTTKKLIVYPPTHPLSILGNGHVTFRLQLSFKPMSYN